MEDDEYESEEDAKEKIIALKRARAEPKFEVYKDKAGEWRWRLRASNGRIIADSGEGYNNKQYCLHGIELVKKEAPNARIIYE